MLYVVRGGRHTAGCLFRKGCSSHVVSGVNVVDSVCLAVSGPRSLSCRVTDSLSAMVSKRQSPVCVDAGQKDNARQQKSQEAAGRAAKGTKAGEGGALLQSKKIGSRSMQRSPKRRVESDAPWSTAKRKAEDVGRAGSSSSLRGKKGSATKEVDEPRVSPPCRFFFKASQSLHLCPLQRRVGL